MSFSVEADNDVVVALATGTSFVTIETFVLHYSFDYMNVLTVARLDVSVHRSSLDMILHSTVHSIF
jgi:hypothetical protein